MKLISVIPNLKEIEHRKLISQELIQDVGEENLIRRKVAQIVTKINTTVEGTITK